MLIYIPIPQCNVALFTSPKCGCKTVSRITVRIFRNPFFRRYHLGTPSTLQQKLDNQQQVYHKNVPQEFKKVTPTRHPFKRLLSCYNYMILGRHSYPTQGSGKKWFKTPLETAAQKSLQDISFTEFVNYIYDTPDNLRDIHFSTQSFLAEDINFDKLIKLENFSQDFKEAIDKFELPVLFPAQIQRNKTNYYRFNIEEITPDIIDKVNDIYEEDFKKFGYCPMGLKETHDYLDSKSFAGPVHQGRLTHLSRKFKT